MMGNKKCWAEKFMYALNNKDSQERYAIETNWWNDFKSQLVIVIEVFDLNMYESDILLAQENKFDNSKLIKEGDYEERTNLINKMKELNKDSIKTMQDYFMINQSLSVNKDFSLINEEAYNMLIQQNYGGPSIRFFVNDIQSHTDLNDKVITSFMEGSDSLKENQYIDLDTIQLGIIIKHKEKTIIEVGYYPKNKSLSHILKVITKRMNIDYTQMAVDMRKTSIQVRKDCNSDQIQQDKKTLAEGADKDFFLLENPNQYVEQKSNKNLLELGIEQNQIIIFTDQYKSAQVFEQDEKCFDGPDLLNFTQQWFQDQRKYSPIDENDQDLIQNFSVQKYIPGSTDHLNFTQQGFQDHGMHYKIDQNDQDLIQNFSVEKYNPGSTDHLSFTQQGFQDHGKHYKIDQNDQDLIQKFSIEKDNPGSTDHLSFTQQGFQDHGMHYQIDQNNQDIYMNLQGQKNNSVSQQRGAANAMQINTARRNNYLDSYIPHNNQCKNATLESTYDSPTQIHNNSIQFMGSDDEGDEENINLIDGNNGINQGSSYPLKRNLLKKNKYSDESTEENDPDDEYNNLNQDVKDFDKMNGTQSNQQQVPRQVIGQAKSQEEIDQINQEIKNALGRNGTLVIQKLTNQQIVQNMIQMINQTQLAIQEQLQQRAKQEKNILQAQQLEKLRFKDFSDLKGDDSERTSSTSTQPENIKKKKRKISNNTLFDENICDAEDVSQFMN
ncbi:hypothetical protein ABPG72_021559 [Tetrahymena utriculariae]